MFCKCLRHSCSKASGRDESAQLLYSHARPCPFPPTHARAHMSGHISAHMSAMHVCTHVCTCTHAHTHRPVWTSIPMSAHVYIHVHACVPSRIYRSIHVSLRRVVHRTTPPSPAAPVAAVENVTRSQKQPRPSVRATCLMPMHTSPLHVYACSFRVPRHPHPVTSRDAQNCMLCRCARQMISMHKCEILLLTALCNLRTGTLVPRYAHTSICMSAHISKHVLARASACMSKHMSTRRHERRDRQHGRAGAAHEQHLPQAAMHMQPHTRLAYWAAVRADAQGLAPERGLADRWALFFLSWIKGAAACVERVF